MTSLTCHPLSDGEDEPEDGHDDADNHLDGEEVDARRGSDQNRRIENDE